MPQPSSLKPLPAERLTTWAAGSESPIGEFVRTTLGPLLLILSTPPAAIIFWIVCTYEPFNGSLSPLLTTVGWRSVVAHWPWPSPSAAAIILVFVALQATLLQWLPGKVFEGPITPAGNRPRYTLNGVPAWFVTHALFFGCSGLHLFKSRDHLGSFRRDPRHARPLRLDLLPLSVFQGTRLAQLGGPQYLRQLHLGLLLGYRVDPTLLGVSLKQLINCRFSMMGWSVIVCAFAAKQAELDPGGHVSNGMLVSVTITVIYLFKFFWWESGYFTSLDIMHDRFGYYICWGVVAWVPAVYALTAQYLVLRPSDLPWPLAAAIFGLGIGAIWVNYAADVIIWAALRSEPSSG